MTADFTSGTVDIKGERVQARADRDGAVSYLNSSGNWRAASAKAAATFVPVEAKPVKVCKKDTSHGEHRITKSGSYCYACDRIVAERQKAERAAAKAAS